MFHRIPWAGLALLMFGTTVPGCWSTPADDAGEEAFAAWATVAILGRRPYSHHEVEALAELAEDQGREAVVDVLLEQPEFVSYWTQVLRNDLRLALANGQASGTETPSGDDCFETSVLSPLYDADLVEHLATESWSQPFCPSLGITTRSQAAVPSRTATTTVFAAASPSATLATRQPSRDIDTVRTEYERIASGTPRQVESPMRPVQRGIEYWDRPLDTFVEAGPQPVSRSNPVVSSCSSFTMRDVFRAALGRDRLDVLYRAALAPHATLNTSQGIASAKFMEAWLNRDPGCVACHTTHYSTTDAAPRNGGWDRTEPATWIDVEGTAFSYTDGGYHYGGDGGNEVGDRIDAFFRDEVFQEGGGLTPWGMHLSCVSQGSIEGFASSIPSGPMAVLGGLQGTSVSPLQLVDQFRLGVASLDLDNPAVDLAVMPVLPGAPGNVATGETLVDTCEASCHNATVSGTPGHIGHLAPYPLTTHTRRMTPARLFDIIMNGSPAGLMTEGWASEDQARDIVAYLTSVNVGHVNNVYHSEPAAGFAHLTAMAIADNVVNEMTGASLVLDHDLPRNADAAAALEELTRVFVSEGWSLKAVIKRIALSDHANRRAPVDSPHDPYELPMVLEPWADVAGTPNLLVGEGANGQGDAVHRWSIASILSQVHHALLWPEPDLFPANDSPGFDNVWADTSLRRDLGDYINFNDRGMDELTLSAMVAWETEIDGCDNRSPNADYIATLADPGHGLTVEQALLAIKDRLISDGRFYEGDALGIEGPVWVSQNVVYESNVVESSLGVDLDAQASANELALRQFCASLLLSPQFLMAGLPAFDELHPPPDPDPALPCVDDRCTKRDHCEHYSDAAADLGYDEQSCGVQGPGGLTWGTR